MKVAVITNITGGEGCPHYDKRFSMCDHPKYRGEDRHCMITKLPEWCPLPDQMENPLVRGEIIITRIGS